MSDAKVIFDESGVCRFPNLHDGMLRGIQSEPQGDRLSRVSLNVYDQTGSSWTLTFIGVQDLVAQEFREGNIIFELRAYSKVPPNEDIKQVLKMIFGDTTKAELINRTLKQLEDGELTLYYLSSSYGCTLVMLSSTDNSSVEIS